VRRADRLYKDLAAEDATQAQRLDAIRQARRYMVVDYDPSHLTPPQLAEAIELAENVLTLQYRLGSEMRNLNSEYPSFTPSPTTEELVDIMHEPHQLTALPTVTDTPSSSPDTLPRP
jgi:arsenate reductase-like glutaredoxin family protein